MTRVTIDATTLAKFQGVDNLIEICDEEGRIVGHFYPYFEPPRDSGGKIISPISDEQWECRRQEQSGRPLKDILADLQER